MANYPIEGLMQTAMENIKQMVDVNTILGDPVETPDGSVIIPISRVSFGFAAGGTEFEGTTTGNQKEQEKSHPFGGGSGAGISLRPVAFLIAGNGQVRVLPVDNRAMFDRLIDYVPQLLNHLSSMTENMGNNNNNKQKEKVKIRETEDDFESGNPLGDIGPYA